MFLKKKTTTKLTEKASEENMFIRLPFPVAAAAVTARKLNKISYEVFSLFVCLFVFIKNIPTHIHIHTYIHTYLLTYTSIHMQHIHSHM